MSTYMSSRRTNGNVSIGARTSILSVETYDRYYDMAFEACSKRAFPVFTVAKDSVMYRNTGLALDIESARTIDCGSHGDLQGEGHRHSSAMLIDNRYSGRRLDDKPGQGAMYTSTISGLLREHAHYNNKERGNKIYAPAVGGKRSDVTRSFLQQEQQGGITSRKFFIYRTDKSMSFADLRLSSLFSFFNSLSAQYLSQFGIVNSASRQFLAAQVNDASDYSAARGMADAIYDTSGGREPYRGICSFSSRADSDSGLVVGGEGDSTGGLVFAIFASPGTVIQDLVPVETHRSYKDMTDSITKKIQEKNAIILKN